MKTCAKCGIEKPLEAFYAHKGMADGRLNKCKECAKADANANRAANLERYQAYDRARANKPDRVAARAAYAATDAGRASMQRGQRAYADRNKQKRAAHVALGNALRDGKITAWPACAVPDCDCTFPEAHHPDYSRPLDVVWLCSKHHKQLHREHRAYLRNQPQKEAA